MTHEPLDPRRDMLVASLYGELSEKDERELQELLAADPELRAEWEELTAGRQFLTQLEEEEATPSFVFLQEESAAAATPVRGGGLWERLRGSFAGMGARPAWGLATAAAVVAILALSDFQVQKVDGGFAFRFGDEAARPTTLDPNEFGAPVGAEFAENGGPGASPGGVPEFRTVGNDRRPATVADLEASEARMLRLMNAMVQDYGNYRSQEVQGMLQAMYLDMSNRQDQVYDDLRGRIETIGVGFMMERNDVDTRFQELMNSVQGQETNDLPPVVGTEDQKQ